MFNVTRDTKEIYIGSAYKNQNKNRNTSYIKPKKEDEEPKLIKLVTKEISLTVQRRRQELKLSQKDLAMKINKNITIIQDIENGKAKYDRNILNKLEKVLNCKIN